MTTLLKEDVQKFNKSSAKERFDMLETTGGPFFVSNLRKVAPWEVIPISSNRSVSTSHQKSLLDAFSNCFLMDLFNKGLFLTAVCHDDEGCHHCMNKQDLYCQLLSTVNKDYFSFVIDNKRYYIAVVNGVHRYFLLKDFYGMIMEFLKTNPNHNMSNLLSFDQHETSNPPTLVFPVGRLIRCSGNMMFTMSDALNDEVERVKRNGDVEHLVGLSSIFYPPVEESVAQR